MRGEFFQITLQQIFSKLIFEAERTDKSSVLNVVSIYRWQGVMYMWEERWQDLLIVACQSCEMET